MAVTRQYGVKDVTSGELNYIDIGAKAENVILEDDQKLSEYITKLEDYKTLNDRYNTTNSNDISDLQQKTFSIPLIDGYFSFGEESIITLNAENLNEFSNACDLLHVTNPYITLVARYSTTDVSLETKKIRVNDNQGCNINYHFFLSDTDERFLTMTLIFDRDEGTIKITNLKERVISTKDGEYTISLYEGFLHSLQFEAIIGSTN